MFRPEEGFRYCKSSHFAKKVCVKYQGVIIDLGLNWDLHTSTHVSSNVASSTVFVTA